MLKADGRCVRIFLPGAAAMSVRQTIYRQWKQAYEIVSGEAKAVVVTEIGPRILSLTLGDGSNLLFEDTEQKIGSGDWRIYGGHRFWIAPETGLTYAPDNAPAHARIAGEELVVRVPVDPATGLEKTLSVAPAPGGFVVRHTLRNTADFLAPAGAVWGLTCMRPTGVCALPWRSGPERWSVANIKLWARWADHGTDLESAQWKPRAELYEVHPTGEEGKIGCFADRGWIGQWTREATFVKRVAVTPGGAYPDGGCNLELYTCSNFIELETVSPMAILGPGEVLEHEERWYVSRPIEMTPKAVEALF